ncbi:MAG: malto-oligosyltrehalose synthase, partial [Verrucomicrobiota bacterium]
MPTSIPTATYRLQFHKGFPFSQATALVPYLHALGITHIYASPFFRATPGSLHGYDVCDHNALNPEVGTREEFDQFVETMHRHGIGLILDFVPNHMGIAEKTNTWWMDILENGPSSVYARFFDIDWHPLKPELEQKVLLPILGDQYGRILESRDLKLHFDEGAFYLDYFGRRLPLSPRTSRPLLERACRELKEAGREAPAELQSIAFTLEHLPDNNETDPVKIEERTREQKIVKSRLRRLCEEQSEVEEAIQEVITDIQSGGKRHDFHAYDQLLRQQSYRLAYWRVAAEEINYRRFFDINNLGAIRMELPEVFDATHRLVMELLASGAVSGLRIDHVDGLWDPRDYLTKLQERYGRLRGESPGTKPLYLLVEKILARGEGLRGDWPVHGTTGYEAAIQIASVLVDPAAEADFTKIYTGFINTRVSYMELTYRSKLLVMRLSMASEVNVLGHMLNRLSETNQWYRDFTLNALTTIIREVIACFPVYRTYLTPDGKIAEEDRHIIFRALSLARRRNPGIERTIFDFLRDVLMPPEPNPHPVDELGRLDFVMKFQQCTGPITAKGIEDTAFYIYNRLVALNEVGGEPHVFGETVDAFHRQNIERFSMFPHSLVATSTHDTKRSEDVRARIAALSEMPQEWMEALQRWQSANREHPVEIDGEIAPDSNEEYLLYQTLLGSWPLAPMSEEERKDYISRIQEYMTKALHEAKVNSSWTEPNTAWDQAVSGFVQKILTPGPGNAFLGDFETMAHRIA